MHKAYNKECPKVSYETFREVFKKQNIGFATPSQDECPSCNKYKIHAIEEALEIVENVTPSTSSPVDVLHEDYTVEMVDNGTPETSAEIPLQNDIVLKDIENVIPKASPYVPRLQEKKPVNIVEDVTPIIENPHDPNICEQCLNYQTHRERYTIAREKYQTDSNAEYPEDQFVYTVDMQKIMIIPKMPIKNSYFVSRLVVMHETFAALHRGKNKCIVWHEAIAGRSSPEVTSAYYNVIRNSLASVTKFLFWVDNCSAQNKN